MGKSVCGGGPVGVAYIDYDDDVWSARVASAGAELVADASVDES